MIKIKSDEEIKIMQEGGKITSGALLKVLDQIKPGMTLLELDAIAEDYIRSKGAEPSFKTVDDYNFTTCININEGIVHGLPNKTVIKEGDVVSIDLGALYKGFHTDLSYTLEIGTKNHQKFLETGLRALNEAVKECKRGNRIGDISNKIQSIVEKEGYSVSRDLVGHGIGRELHEPPYVPGYGRKKDGPRLLEGMVFAVEVIYQMGKPDIIIIEDDWTIETADGSLSGLFEKTVAITHKGPLVITDFS